MSCVSASVQPCKESVKHIQSANAQTHKTLSAADQPSKENVKHLLPANAQIHETLLASDKPVKMSSTYGLQTRKHTRLC